MKKIVLVLLSLLMCCGIFAGCGDSKEVVKLKVWGSQQDQYMLGEMVESFIAANPDKTYDIEFGVVAEADAKGQILSDPAAAADVFFFADDHTVELVKADALYKIEGTRAEKIKSENSEGSVNAATVAGTIYAYPSSADNTFFLYYNKKYVTDEQVNKMNDILSAANSKSKKFFFDLSNGWYNSGFFLTAGCGMNLDDKGNQTLTGFDTDKAVYAAKAMNELAKNSAFETGDDSVVRQGLNNDTYAAVVSGSWMLVDFKQAWGDDMGVAKMPIININGEEKQFINFGGSKLCGVSKLTKSPEEALALASWLTNEDNQLKRFRDRGNGPSNKAAAATDEVKSNKVIAAISEQFKYTVPQASSVTGTWWNPAEAFGAEFESNKTKTFTDAELRELINKMVEQIVPSDK